jgi:aspartate/methionine/tyrosine aminotransferase
VPAHPRLSAHAQKIRTATFEAFAGKLREKFRDPEFVPLHLGDTFLPPPAPALSVPLEDPALHRYGPVTGLAALREAGAQDITRFGLPVGAEDVFVGQGATGGLDLALNATLEPGDEVIVLTPTWPLLLGLLQRRGAVPVEVDVDPSGWLPADPAVLAARVEAALTPKTCGLSFCNPNNPGGFVYGGAHLEALGAIAAKHDLWIYYDAVYVDLEFEPEGVPLAFVAGAARERTFVATSFSKSFGLAGHRTGLLVTPPCAREILPRLCTHSTYHAGHMGQRMALASLEDDPRAERRKRLDAARSGASLTVEALRGLVPFQEPEGGAFVLLDLRDRAADEAATLDLLGRCLDAGVSLAPGSAFGSRFGRFARVCFTSVPPDRLAVGLNRLKSVLA